ncbi:MAG: metallophosphoesterase family protein, partial [Pseudomonadota bacterium]
MQPAQKPDDRHPLFVFGGPYSNLQATEAALRAARARQIPASNIICTGDVVAYAGDPEASVQLIRDSGITVVAGNCEEQLAEAADDCGCGFEEGSACDALSKRWYAFADAQVTAASRAWMKQLPTYLTFAYNGLTIAVVHATRASNNDFIFASQSEQIASAFAACHADIVFAGHSGTPFITPVGAGAWVNAGVVGVPANDGTTDGWFAVLEPGDDHYAIRI